MATFTVSATGGNWSSGSTWVGGVAPNPTGDDIIVPSGAGNLTVDINRSCLTITFQTGYNNTFKINDSITLTVTGTAITLVSGMFYDSTTTGILNTNANQATITITFAGITIHRLAIGHNIGAGAARSVVISGTTPTVRNFIFSTTPTGGAVTLSGTALNITNSFLISGITGSGTLSGTTPLFSGTVTLSQTGGTGGRINCGFTVLTGSTLVIGSNITAFLSGIITFQASSFLTPSTFTVTIGAGCTLNTNVVTWYNLEFNDAGTRTLTSDLNISNNFTFVLATNNTNITAASTRNINVSGSITSNASYAQGAITCTNIVINLIGTGTYAVATITGITININSSNPSGYVLGNATYTGANYMSIFGTLNLVGSTVASAFTGTPFFFAGTIDTNRSSTGGSNIIYSSVINSGNLTLNSDTSVSGNFSSNAGGGNSITVNGSKLLIGGNLTFTGIVTSVSGTSTIEFYGPTSASLTFVANTTVTNNITVNKSGSATLSLLSSFTWGGPTRNFTLITGNTLILNGNLTVTEGTLTVPATATLTPNLNTLSFTTTGAKTLNTPNVTWYNVINNTLTTLVTLSSVLNISNNLSFTNTSGSGGCGFTGNFLVNVSGSLLLNDTGTIAGITFTGGGSINMIGTGTIRGATSISFTLNINTPTSYVIGDATFPTTVVGNLGVINLQGTSIVSVYSATGHTLTLNNGATINTNNTPTGANLPSGTQILWGNILTPNNSTITISQPITAQGNLTSTTASITININGAKVIVFGNLSYTNNSTLQGSSEIELGGSGNSTWFGGNYRNNITINKTSIGVLTLSGSISWGASGRILQKTAGNINPSTSTVTIPNSINVTISGMTFWSLTIPGASTITQNTANTIQNNLTLGSNGNVAFDGTAGWTCANLFCTPSTSRTITLQNSVTYRTTTGVQLVGTAANPITMISVNLSIRAIWTLDYGATQNIIYVNGTRIDSSLGQTIWTFGGLISTTPLGAETLNWRTGTRPGTIAHVFLN